MTREAICIKGTREGLAILLDCDREWEDIKKNLHNKMSVAGNFFRGARFAFFGNKSIPQEKNSELVQICQQYGLVYCQDVRWPPVSKASNPAPAPAQAPNLRNLATRREGRAEASLHWQHLRSGQVLTSSGGLVLVGDVHPGAEIIAAGSVVIWGKCRGRVQAGTRDPHAYVTALELKPSSLQIGSITAPETLFVHLSGPILAWVEGDAIICRDI
ncbi:MAG: septum site-determining protein MinC [Bacillota bacterium]